MQTPTTTTRENSGAPAMIPSSIPGTPTHSKMTGALGVVAPTFSSARQTCHHGSGARLIFSTPPSAASMAAGRVTRWPWSAADA